MPNKKLENTDQSFGVKDDLLKEKSMDKKLSIDKYVGIPADDLSAKELKWGLWQAGHRLLLYKISFGLLIAVIIFVWGFSIWGWVNYFLQFQNDQLVQADLTHSIDYTYFHQAFGAKALQINSVQSFNSGVEKYDAVADIKNPNENFIVYFNYYFSVNGTTTASQSAFLLPGENRPVVIMGIKSSSDIGTPDFNDPKSWQDRHLNFTISSSTFIKSSTSGAGADIIRFSLTNNSPYDYYTPFFYVGLFQSGNLAGVMPLYFDSFESSETKEVDLRSLAPSLQITEVEVYPTINVYNPEAYISGSL